MELKDLTTVSLVRASNGTLLRVHKRLHEVANSLLSTHQQEAILANIALHQEICRRGLDVVEKGSALDQDSFHAGTFLGLDSEDLESIQLQKSLEHSDVKLLPIEKVEEDKRIVFGVVLEPHSVDAQNDTITPAEIEQAAHRWLAKFQNRGLMHEKLVNSRIEIFESYIAPVDLTIGGQSVKKGTWLLMYHVLDETLWKRIKSGEITGFSIGGFARRSGKQ